MIKRDIVKKYNKFLFSHFIQNAKMLLILVNNSYLFIRQNLIYKGQLMIRKSFKI